MTSSMLLAKNRKALHEFTVLQKYIAGIELLGAEVKAVREGKANFTDAYIILMGNEVFVINLYIGEYSKQSRNSVVGDVRRSRKLLLNRHEIKEIAAQLLQKGNTAIPLALVLQNNLIKVEFAVVKGKKEFEKKVVAKERQILKDLERDSKDLRRSES